jgi:hypothetical protein
MSKRTKWLAVVAALALLAGGYLAYRQLRGPGRGPVPELLDFMPPEATTVLYADLAALRQSPFLEELRSLAPSPEADREYAEFVRETGFDYARDLDRVAVVMLVRGKESSVFAVADGRFNRNRIREYALRSGRQETMGGREAYSTPLSGRPKRITLAFLGNNRIALTDGPDLVGFLAPRKENPAGAPWRERFSRLAGSPVFAVSGMNPESASMASRAAGGLRSDQLATLVASLRWGTLAARPDGDHLRVVAEGECSGEESARQLSGVVSGLVLIARAGLADPKTQRQVGPEAIAAIEEVLKNVDVSRIDRGETKAVRVVIEVTPRFLQALRQMSSQPPAR